MAENYFIAAFNPCNIDVEPNSILIGVPRRVYFSGEDGKKFTIDMADVSGKGVVRIDISQYVRRLFGHWTTTVEGIPLYADRLFRYKWTISVMNEVQELLTYAQGTAINAVVQVGEDPDLTKQRGTFRTEFPDLRKYKGYELTVGIIPPLATDGRPKINSLYIEHKEFADHCIFEVSNQSKLTLSIEKQTGWIPFDEVQQELAVEQVFCTPNNPFYVRWINQMGGYDYWMFGKRQVFTNKTENKKTFKPYIYDIKRAQITTELYKFDVTEQVVVGVEQLKNEHFKPLSKIILSPQIEWYNESTSKWIQVYIADYDFDYNTAKSSQDIEITFSLPDKQLQF